MPTRKWRGAAQRATSPKLMATPEAAAGLWSFVIKGGPVMLPIIAGSIVAGGIVLERYWTLWQYRRQLVELSGSLSAQVESGRVSDALRACQEQATPLGHLFATALLHRSQEHAELTRRLERPGAEVVADLESYMGALATIVGIEPLLGFLGTIVGMIKAFMEWEQMGETITINVLAGGIYEAMITTAAGLIVAIPCYLAYNHLVARVAMLTRLTEARTEALVDLLGRGGKRETILRAV